MAAVQDLLTPAEAAVVAGVTVRDVNRVIDEGILPKRFYTVAGGRRVHAAGCTYVRFYFHSAKALTPDERSHVIRTLSASRKAAGPETWMVRDGFLTIDLKDFAADTQDRRSKLDAARELVVEDPGVLSGTPVVRGTRVPIYDVAALVAARTPLAEILETYPSLDATAVELAAIYAEATPPRGRPRRLVDAEPALRLIASRKVPRRARA